MLHGSIDPKASWCELLICWIGNPVFKADQLIKIIEMINSEWLGIILDTGSYRVNDPYEEIARSVKYAVSWQIKSHLFINDVEQETDISKIVNIIKSSGYEGIYQ